MRVSTRMAGYYQLMLSNQAGEDGTTSAAQQRVQQLINQTKKTKTPQKTENTAELPDSKDARLRAVAAKYEPTDMKGSDLGRVAKELYQTGAISQSDAHKLMSKAMRGANYVKPDEESKLDWIKETQAEIEDLKKKGKNTASSERVLEILKLVDAAGATAPVSKQV